jgi:hypothetical protein
MSAKWTRVVRFKTGQTINVPTARGRRDAVLQAYWMVKDQTGQWAGAVAEVTR